MTPEEKTFIRGLEKLSRETGIIIAGCGCCGSPFMDELEQTAKSENAGYAVIEYGQIMWIAENDKDDWRRYAAKIIE